MCEHTFCDHSPVSHAHRHPTPMRNAARPPRHCAPCWCVVACLPSVLCTALSPTTTGRFCPALCSLLSVSTWRWMTPTIRSPRFHLFVGYRARFCTLVGPTIGCLDLPRWHDSSNQAVKRHAQQAPRFHPVSTCIGSMCSRVFGHDACVCVRFCLHHRADMLSCVCPLCVKVVLSLTFTSPLLVPTCTVA